MIIKEIRLSNFRSHKQYILRLGDTTTQILGENGWGKTSVLEAVYIALQGRSFRAVDREIVRRETDFYRIEIEFTDGEKVVVVYDNRTGKKKFLVADKNYMRLPREKKYPIVLFTPDDLHLVGSSPASKRDFFGRVAGQIFPEYSAAMRRYDKALRQRNELLKQEYTERDSLFSWDVMLAKYGVDIRKLREEIIRELNERLTEVYRGIAENEDEVSVEYKSYTDKVDESEYLRLLEMDFGRDTLTGHTNFGVHKDDFNFVFNGVSADGSASRGEVRSLIIALKFIEAELLFSKLSRKPIVLLDDVFSELDATRSAALVKNFQENQVILTSVE